MVSLKKFFNQEPVEANDYLRILSVLAEAIAIHAVDFEPEMRQTFQFSVRASARHLREASSEAEALGQCGQLIHNLQVYHQSTENLIRAQALERQAVLTMVTNCLSRLARGSAKASSNLRALEKQLEKASHLEDIRAIKGKIGEALSVVQDEAARHERFEAEMREQVEISLSDPATLLSMEAEFDPVTGLGNSRAAEAALRNMFKEKRILFPVVFFLERLDLINHRFGFEAGDKVLAAYGQHLAQHIRSDETLFRWRGPSFLALLDRHGKVESVRSEARKVSSAKLQHSIRVGDRDVFLPLTCANALIPASQESGYDELLKRINVFVMEQTARFAQPD